MVPPCGDKLCSPRQQKVYVLLSCFPDKQDYPVAAVRLHPNYNIGKLKNRGIPEFYDYDVALIKLEEKVTFSFHAR